MPGSERSPEPLLVRATVAIAAGIVARYPASFRARFGNPALQHVADLARRTRQEKGPLAVLALWPRLFWDLRPKALTASQTTQPLPSRSRSPMLDNFLQDLNFARRSMARSPGNTSLAILVLAIGIGASASMFSVIDAVMLRPLPYPDSERIMSVALTVPEWQDNPATSDWWDRARWSYDEVVEWRQRQESFEVAAAIGRVSATMTGRGPADRVRLGLAGVGLFEVFGAVPFQGRFFGAEDEGDEAVAVVSHAFWQMVLGGDAQAIGSDVVLDSDRYRIVGILPEGFEITGYPQDLWIPIFSSNPSGFFPGNTGAMDHTLLVMGRLRAGRGRAAAEAESASILAALPGDDHFAGHSSRVVSLIDEETRGLWQPMMLLMGAVFMLLVVACANVATLLLGQAIDRRQEIAVRAAVGAGRSRVVRQLLTESLVLGAVAGVLGLALARLGMIGVTALAPPTLPRLDVVALDLRVAGFAVGVSLLAAFLFGLAPALSAGSEDLSSALRTARTGSAARTRMQSGMIVAEIALATVLLVGAALLTRSFMQLNAVDPGFDSSGLVTVRVAVDTSPFRAEDGTFDDGALRTYVDGIVEPVRSLPGVVGAVVGHPPFSGSGANNSIVPQGYVPRDENEFLLGHRRFVRGGYFELLGIRLVEGRTLRESDDHPEAAPVVVVTRNIADTFFPGESAVGKTLTWWGADTTIVGVVEDVVDSSLELGSEYTFYGAESRFGFAGSFFTVRVDGDATDYLETIRNRLRETSPNTPILRLQPLADRVSASIDQARFRTRLIGLFAVVSAVLSVLGVYGVTSRAVAGRARELGVRVALGAVPSRVMSLVLSGAVRLAAIGAVLGIAIALVATRLIEGFLYEVEPNDPFTLAAIVLLVSGLAILASLIPSVRASRVDPVEVLRREG